jgi:hypothetical protein
LFYQPAITELRQVGGLSPAFASLVEASLAALDASLDAFDALDGVFAPPFLFFFFSAIYFMFIY